MYRVEITVNETALVVIVAWATWILKMIEQLDELECLYTMTITSIGKSK